MRGGMYGGSRRGGGYVVSWKKVVEESEAKAVGDRISLCEGVMC